MWRFDIYEFTNLIQFINIYHNPKYLNAKDEQCYHKVADLSRSSSAMGLA